MGIPGGSDREPELFRRKLYLPDVAARRGTDGIWEADLSLDGVNLRATTDERSASAHLELQGYDVEHGELSHAFGVSAAEAATLRDLFAELASLLGDNAH